MNRISRFVLSGACSLASVAAHAADMPIKAPPPMTAPAAVYNWTGLYVGVNGGWGWGEHNPLEGGSSSFLILCLACYRKSRSQAE
jgi:outer membrane immunogenic protein